MLSPWSKPERQRGTQDRTFRWCSGLTIDEIDLLAFRLSDLFVFRIELFQEG